MLNVSTPDKKVVRGFSITPDTAAMIERLAEVYDTNRSRIIEALVSQYGPKLLEQKLNKENATP